MVRQKGVRWSCGVCSKGVGSNYYSVVFSVARNGYIRNVVV